MITIDDYKNDIDENGHINLLHRAMREAFEAGTKNKFAGELSDPLFPEIIIAIDDPHRFKEIVCNLDKRHQGLTVGELKKLINAVDDNVTLEIQSDELLKTESDGHDTFFVTGACITEYQNATVLTFDAWSRESYLYTLAATYFGEILG